MKLASRITTWVGALILFVAPFLKFEFGSSLWSLSAGNAALLTLVMLAAVGFSIVSIFVDRPVFVAGQLALSFYAFGETLEVGRNFDGLQVGYWLTMIGALVMITGACLLVAAIWDRQRWRPTTGFVGDRATRFTSQAAGRPAPPTGYEPAAGWYPDPSGHGAERYWSGSGWTEQVR